MGQSQIVALHGIYTPTQTWAVDLGQGKVDIFIMKLCHELFSTGSHWRVKRVI